MKETIGNIIEILISILAGGFWGFLCSRMIPITWFAIICAGAGGFAIGIWISVIFYWIKCK